MRPMSWFSGSQVTKVSLVQTERPSSIARMFAIRLACVTMTPLGAEVEPEVYCRKAMSVAAGVCGRHASAPAASISSTAMSVACAKASATPAIASRMAAWVSTQQAPASAAMPSSLPRWRLRVDSGGNTGTATRPA
ncbi:hypothetical protein D9M68_671400 [compost metagenome]